MTLQEQLSSDLKTNMKSGNAFEVGVLRMLVAACNNKIIEHRGKGLPETLTDENVLDVLRREAKKRKEATEAYRAGGRAELADTEQKELVIIQRYLPAEISSDAINLVLDEVLIKHPQATEKEFGALMGEAMAVLKGKAEASTVSVLLKERLRRSS